MGGYISDTATNLTLLPPNALCKQRCRSTEDFVLNAIPACARKKRFCPSGRVVGETLQKDSNVPYERGAGTDPPMLSAATAPRQAIDNPLKHPHALRRELHALGRNRRLLHLHQVQVLLHRGVLDEARRAISRDHG